MTAMTNAMANEISASGIVTTNPAFKIGQNDCKMISISRLMLVNPFLTAKENFPLTRRDKGLVALTL